MLDFSRIFYMGTSCLSYVVSSLLIYLVLTASPKSMQNFAVLILDAATGDLVLATVDAVTEVR